MGICNDNSWWGYAGILCAGWLSGLVYDRLVRWCDGFYSWTAQNWLMNYPEIHNTEIQGTQWKKEPPYLNKCVGLIHVSSSTLLCFFFWRKTSRLGVQALGLLVRIWAYLMLALLAIVIWLSGFLGTFEYIWDIWNGRPVSQNWLLSANYKDMTRYDMICMICMILVWMYVDIIHMNHMSYVFICELYMA